MANTAQTQANIRGVRFYAKSYLAKKPDRVQKIYSVKVTHKNAAQTQTKMSAFQKAQNARQFP